MIGFEFVVGDFEEGLRKWNFVLDWMLLRGGSNFMIGYFIKFYN